VIVKRGLAQILFHVILVIWNALTLGSGKAREDTVKQGAGASDRVPKHKAIARNFVFPGRQTPAG
jgi:hypothetical protein